MARAFSNGSCLPACSPYALVARFHAGWQLRGSGIQFRMRPGTVVPSNHSVYIAADLKAFRSVHGVNSPVFVVGPSYGTFPSEGSVTVSLYDRYEHLGMFTHCLPHFPTWYDAVDRGRVSWKVIIYIVYHITWMNCALLLNVYHLFVAIYILLYIYIYCSLPPGGNEIVMKPFLVPETGFSFP